MQKLFTSLTIIILKCPSLLVYALGYLVDRLFKKVLPPLFICLVISFIAFFTVLIIGTIEIAFCQFLEIYDYLVPTNLPFYLPAPDSLKVGLLVGFPLLLGNFLWFNGWLVLVCFALYFCWLKYDENYLEDLWPLNPKD
jgi:hypothetical protein